MSNLLEPLEEALSRHLNWRARAESCRFLMAALNYANETALPVTLYNEATADGEPAGSASLFPREIELSYDAAAAVSIVIQDFSHETKHIAQFDSAPELQGMEKLSFDLKRSKQSGRYELDEQYLLPSALEDTLLRLGEEIDAYTYGFMAADEASAIFHENNDAFDPSQNSVDSSGATALFLGIVNSGVDYIGHNLSIGASTLDLLDEIKLRHDAGPAIVRRPISDEEIIAVSKGLWSNCGVNSPLIKLFNPREDGLSRVLKDQIIQHEGYAAMEVRMERLFLNPKSTHIPNKKFGCG